MHGRSLVACALLCACADFEEPDTPVIDEPDVSELLGGLDRYALRLEASEDALGALRRFYEARDGRPAWFDDRDRPREAVIDLLARLGAADAHGLDPDDYGVDGLLVALHRNAAGPPLADPALDVALSEAFLAHARHLANGRLPPGWDLSRAAVDPVPALEDAVESGDVGAALDAVAPAHAEYVALLDELAALRAIEELGGWPGVAPGRTYKPGDRADPAVLGALRERLWLEGYVSVATDGATVYDEALADAVRAWQRRHGLVEDGVLGERVRDELNVPVEDRIRTVRVNLERWRWMPRELGARHVRVNIPSFSLELVEGGEPALSMAVVVGRRETRTPIFADAIETVIVNPYWTVPPGIARDEIAPLGPGYFARRGFQVVDRRGRPVGGAYDPRLHYLRQQPGAGNALGRLKFDLPNPHAVYLHDTPAKALFARSERAFSHGCVRVERPLDLAERLLTGVDGWDRGRIERAIASGRHQPVALPEPVPVYIVYFTALQDADGEIALHRDVYGHDRALARALDGG